MKETVFEAKELTKTYGKHTVLRNVSLSIGRGEIVGLIGRNGAGKTTLMRLATGLSKATGGTCTTFGDPTNGSNDRMGCLIDYPAFFSDMSAKNNLKYYCIQKGITDLGKIDKALERVKLGDTGKKKYKNFSLGMKQRLGIAFAIMDEPEFLILDEPINGLDPIGISDIRDLLIDLNTNHNITILISSHILSELYNLADRFIFIDGGRILKDITKKDLDDCCRVGIKIKCEDVTRAVVALEKEAQIKDYTVISDTDINVYDDLTPEDAQRILSIEGINVFSVTKAGISLEDYFKSLLGGEHA
ncbi:MAG: ATP-binding cassette domain-containing protein [Clostridiales bacterium]|nr:ATP-binding cassette domain-containing protein [Clostridiales bacterium]